MNKEIMKNIFLGDCKEKSTLRHFSSDVVLVQLVWEQNRVTPNRNKNLAYIPVALFQGIYPIDAIRKRVLLFIESEVILQLYTPRKC
jgi:hypothetical protein